MRHIRTAALLAVASVVALGAVTQATAAPKPLPKPAKGLTLEFYSATVSTDQYRDLLAKGYDIASADDVAGGVRLSLVLTPKEVGLLKKLGVKVAVIRNAKGRTALQEAAAQRSTGYDVWRDYDGSDGFAAELRRRSRRRSRSASRARAARSGRSSWPRTRRARATSARPCSTARSSTRANGSPAR
jgi:hypothetical protein